MLRRLMPTCWFGGNSTADKSSAENSSRPVTKTHSNGSNYSNNSGSKKFRRSGKHKPHGKEKRSGSDFGNQLSVDIFDEGSSTSDVAPYDGQEALEIVKLSENQKTLLRYEQITCFRLRFTYVW